MGNFYTNYTLRGPSQKAVVLALAGRRAIVTRSQSGCVVAFDEESDNQDQEMIAEVASRLSSALACPVLAIVNHDDDILWYQLYSSGALIDEYDSSPGYFDPSAEPSAPAGGKPDQLAAAFGATNSAVIERILRNSSYDDDGYVFEIDRHKDLVRALGLPEFALGTCYTSLDAGEYPKGLAPGDLKHTS